MDLSKYKAQVKPGDYEGVVMGFKADNPDFDFTPLKSGLEPGDWEGMAFKLRDYEPPKQDYSDSINSMLGDVDTSGATPYDNTNDIGKNDSDSVQEETNTVNQHNENTATVLSSMAKSVAEVPRAAMDAVGIDTPMLDKQAEFADVLAKRNPGSATVGEIGGEVLLYAKTELSYVANGMVGAFQGASKEYNKEDSTLGGAIVEGAKSGVLALATTKIGKVIQHGLARTSNHLNDMIKELDVDSSTLDNIYREYGELAGKSILSKEDKTLAILSNSAAKGNERAKGYLAAVAHDDKASQAILSVNVKIQEDAAEAVRGSAFTDTSKVIHNWGTSVGKLYDDLEEVGSKIPITDKSFISSMYNGLKGKGEAMRTSTDNSVLTRLDKMLKGEERATVKDFIQFRQAISTTKNKDLIAMLDNTIDKHLTDVSADMAGVFKIANDKNTLRNSVGVGSGKNLDTESKNVVAELLTDMTDNGYSTQNILDGLHKVISSNQLTPKHFKQIAEVMETNLNMAQFEKGLADMSFKSGASLKNTYELLKRTKMVTSEGKQYKDRLNKFVKTFGNLDLDTNMERIYENIERQGGKISQGLSTSLIAKLKYTIASNVWDKVHQRILPLTENAKFAATISSIRKDIVKANKHFKLDPKTKFDTSKASGIVKISNPSKGGGKVTMTGINIVEDIRSAISQVDYELNKAMRGTPKIQATK